MGAFHAYDIRGLYGVEFTKDDAYKVGYFLPRLLNTDKVAIGHDCRLSSPEIYAAAIAGICDAGADAYVLGLATTPYVYFVTANYGFNASIQITASHNPKEYNGMKVSTTNALPVGLESGLDTIQQWILSGEPTPVASRRGREVEFDKKKEYMFGGMPTYQIGSKGMKVDRIGFNFQNAVHLFLDHMSPIYYLLGYFIGFLIMLRAFGINRWMSVIGAIAIAFSSYFFIIIAAGHNSKAECLGDLAPIIGGFYLIFRNRKYLVGAALVMVYSMLAYYKHPQMAYYVLLMLVICGIAEIVMHAREKQLPQLFISLAVFVGATLVGLGPSYPTLKSNSEYMKETMRGGHSDLASTNEASSVHNTSGLSFEYATQWSYGIDETMTLLVPNYMGGASGYNVGENSKPYKTMVAKGVPAGQAREIVKQMPTYWGDQPFTSGPVYVGAIICFLFLLGCLIVPGPYKWALLISTILSILLSWGHNFKWLSELFYNYFPFYDKFRTVSSILVVAEIAMGADRKGSVGQGAMYVAARCHRDGYGLFLEHFGIRERGNQKIVGEGLQQESIAECRKNT